MYYNVIFHNTNTAYNNFGHGNIFKTHVTPEWRPYSVPTALKKCRSPGCALYKRQQHWTDRPTDRGTDATKRIHYSPPHDKKCV